LKRTNIVIYRLLLAGILCFTASAGYAQEKSATDTSADSLRQLLIAAEDTIRVNKLNELSNFYRYRNLDSLKYYSEKAIELSRTINYPKGLFTAYADKSWFFFSRGEYDSAIEVSQTALNQNSVDEFPSLKARLIQNIGISYGSLGSYKIAADYFIQAKEIFENIDDTESLKTINNNLGVIYLFLENYQAALDIFLELDAIEQQQQNPAISTAVNLGFIYYELKKYDKATEFLNRALAFDDEGTDPRGKGLASFKLGEVYAAQKNFDKALNLFERSISIYNELNNEVGTVQSLNGIAKVYLDLGNIQKAKETALEADQICIRNSALPERRETTKILSEIYRAEQSYKKALDFFELHKSISDSLIDDKTSGEIARLEAAYEFEKKQRELVLQQQQKEIETQQQLAEQQLYIYIIAGALLVAIIIIFFIYRNYRVRKKANQLLSEKNKEIEKKTRELEETNKVKNRLFSIISHDLRSPISSLSNMISLMEMDELSKDDIDKITPQLADRFRYTSTLLNNLLFWARSQMDGFNLTKKPTDVTKLIQETIELVKGKASEKQISIKYLDSAENTELLIDKSMIQLVLLNLLSNAIKFSNSGTTVKIRVEKNSSYTTFCVSDYGVGIDEERLSKLFETNFFTTKGTEQEKGTGLGLMLCKDFVEKHSGKIWVESEYGKGSNFFFSLPN